MQQAPNSSLANTQTSQTPEAQAPQAQLDPFSKARQMQATKDASVQPATNPMQPIGSPFDNPGALKMFDDPNGVKVMSPSDANNAAQLFKSQDSSNKADFTTSQVPQMLTNLGIDNSNIALNPLGRMQLMGRLKSKFGGDFMNNPQAKEVLSKFDEYLKNAPNDAARSLSQTLEKGKRTLDALMGTP